MEDRIVVAAAREVLQEINPHQLLGEGRAALRQQQSQRLAALPLRKRTRNGFAEDPRQDAVVDPGMVVEILVFRGKNCLAQHQRYLVELHDAAIFTRQLDQNLAIGIAHQAGRRRLEAQKGFEIGQIVAVEIEVVGHPRTRQGEQQKRRHEEENQDGPAPTQAFEPRCQHPNQV